MADAESSAKISDSELQDLVIESDSGARRPTGSVSIFVLMGVALLWSLFQLWIVSPLPYTTVASNLLSIPIFDSTNARYIHLAFALFLTFLAYPANKSSPRTYIPIVDWMLAFLGVFVTMYLYFLSDELALRSGLPTDFDVLVAGVGVMLLLSAAKRALGPPLVVIAAVFLFYTFVGNASFMPDLIAHKGQSVSKVASHQWLSTEGVFGIALGVSVDFVFLFVLFGALLEKAGAGNYFIKLAFALLGHMRGGPAKAAVLASAMTGLISGSSIANVVTTGTFTIPLMRRVGFSREKAGAVEVASSVNGQIMPPVMGAAAFLMVEYVGVSYVDVVRAAFIPAVISYIALLYLVHLEAVKTGMTALPKENKKPFFYALLSSGITIASMIILAGIIYYVVNFIKNAFGESAVDVIIAGIVLSYIALLWYSSKVPPLEMDDPSSQLIKLPDAWDTLKTGLHYILPIIILIWCLMIEKLSPGLSAFWATVFLIFIVITQKPLLVFFRKTGEMKQAFIAGVIDLLDGLMTGARNMVGIGVATAAAGIIVGAVSLTGIGQVITELIETISGGSFILVLIFTAICCLILGMGLPTTANYIVVASLLANVIVELGQKEGLFVPLIAVHMFVFYFGIMADITPPVGLASFAAAAISGGDPIKTGLQAFVYSIRTIILPFVFIYNIELLLIGVETVWYGIVVFLKGTIAVMVFAAAMQGYFLVRNKLHETILLFLVSFCMFRAGYFVDIITPKYMEGDVKQIEKLIDNVKPGRNVVVEVVGTDSFGDRKQFKSVISIKSKGTGVEKLEEFGLILAHQGNRVIVDDVVFNSRAEDVGFNFDFEIISVNIPQEQMSRNWIYSIALLLLAFIMFRQNRRKSEIIDHISYKSDNVTNGVKENV